LEIEDSPRSFPRWREIFHISPLPPPAFPFAEGEGKNHETRTPRTPRTPRPVGSLVTRRCGLSGERRRLHGNTPASRILLPIAQRVIRRDTTRSVFPPTERSHDRSDYRLGAYRSNAGPGLEGFGRWGIGIRSIDIRRVYRSSGLAVPGLQALSLMRRSGVNEEDRLWKAGAGFQQDHGGDAVRALRLQGVEGQGLRVWGLRGLWGLWRRRMWRMRRLWGMRRIRDHELPDIH